MCCGTARSESRRPVVELSVSGLADRRYKPRNRPRTMRPLESLMPNHEHFNPNSLHHSLDIYYIDIYSDSWGLGRWFHRVIGRRSKVVVCNRHTGVPITTLCSHVDHYQWKNMASTYINNTSQTTKNDLAIRRMSRMHKRWLWLYYVANITRQGCASEFVILTVSVRPIFVK